MAFELWIVAGVILLVVAPYLLNALEDLMNGDDGYGRELTAFRSMRASQGVSYEDTSKELYLERCLRG